MYIEPIKELAENLGVISESSAHPCTAEEIVALEHTLNIKFPLAYKEFLGWIGNGADDFMPGSGWRYVPDNLISMQEHALELLVEINFPKNLPKNAFVFFSHQGYVCYFFEARGGEDENPIVYYFGESEEELTDFQCVFWSFTHFLEYNVKLTYLHNSNAPFTDRKALAKQYYGCP